MLRRQSNYGFISVTKVNHHLLKNIKSLLMEKLVLKLIVHLYEVSSSPRNLVMMFILLGIGFFIFIRLFINLIHGWGFMV